jgi:hypothetical protein
MSDPFPRPFVLDPRLSGVPAETLRSRRDRPVQLTFPALEWAAIQLAAVTSPFGRPLYLWESEIIQDIFQRGVDASRVRIVETRILAVPTTLGNQIRVPPGWSFSGERRAVLVHEVAHVWQFQTQGTAYITDSVYHNASGQIATGNRNVAYMNYQLRPESRITDFSAEEQATIIGDYYELTRIHQSDPNPPGWVAVRRPDLPIYERLIHQVRSSTPRTDQQVYEQSLMSQPSGGIDWSLSGSPQLAPTVPLIQFRF